jgi:hypothetical protein
VNKKQKKAETDNRTHALQAEAAFRRAKRKKAINYAGENPWEVPKNDVTTGTDEKKRKAE